MFARLKHAIGSSRKAAAGAARRDRRLTPAVSGLESRALLTSIPLVPNGAPLFVTELYNDLLQRDPDPGELSYNVNYLRNGGSIETLTHKIVTSTERKAVVVTSFYETYLGREPDPDGLAFQVNLLNHGVKPVDVQRGIIASPEFQNAHVSNVSYVDALYVDILGRAPDAAGEAYWVSALENGMSRDRVALSFFNTQEYATRIINADFNLVLNRNAEPGAIHYWTPSLAQTGKDGELLVALFASNENLNNIRTIATT